MVQTAGWKCFPQINTLAYYNMELVITAKKFYGTICSLEIFSRDKCSSLLHYGISYNCKKSFTVQAASWKCFPGTNTLAYDNMELVMTAKKLWYNLLTGNVFRGQTL
jgi:hypothetical protein